MQWKVIKAFPEDEVPINLDGNNLWEVVKDIMTMLLFEYPQYQQLRFVKSEVNRACSCHPEWHTEWDLEGIPKEDSV